MGKWSIRQRVTRSLMALVAVLWIVGVSATGLVAHHEINEIFDGVLRESTEQIIPVALLQYRLEKSSEAEAFAAVRATAPKLGHLQYLLRATNGTILVSSTRPPAEIWPLPTENGFHDKGKLRYYARFLPEEQAWIEVSQQLHEREEAVRGLWLGLASPLIALLPIAAFTVWRTVRRATEPIARVSNDLAARGGDYLDPIGGEGLPEELTPVIHAVNTLMKRLKAALESERAFAANAAHELRNPIASARAQIQVLATEIAGTAGQARAENIASGLAQLGRRIERLLQMSRADAGLGQSRERTDLAAIVALLVDDYRRRPGVGSRLRLTDDTGGGGWVALDQDALAIVLRNAIENAVTHGTADTPVDVHVTADRKVRIVNACEPVAPEVLQGLKERFRRGTTGTVGSGLGLAIVDTIMRQAGGSVTLRSPAEGRSDGFEIVLALPPAP